MAERKQMVMTEKKIGELVSMLTLEEKAGLTSGKDNWFTKAVERLGVPQVRTSDGPHGLRTQAGKINSLEENASIPAVCFPAACATAASFDRDLLYRMGEALGRECQSTGVHVLLGPGVNIKRSPLCGRNFEYFSEDPYLAGELGAAFVKGVQSQGVGTSLKHFFANSQEHRRMDASSEMDERTMREIYLPAFETVVKQAQPWTVMASYNKIGGVYSTANRKYLTDLLRKEWGFEGVVTSDWGATHDRPAAVAAGCDLTMPAEDTDHLIVEAVRNGTLSEEALDACCIRLLKLAFRAAEQHRENIAFDYEGDHALAREIAGQSVVLLKNEDNILPLAEEADVAFIGPFAKEPRYQGGGSSHINSFKVVGALEAAEHRGVRAQYAAGCRPDGETDELLLAQAIEKAKQAKIAVVFAGLTDGMESEGVDRRHMRLPEGHNMLIEAVCAANPNTVVVLHNGSPVEMPWVDRPKAILECYLAGQAAGEAVTDVLYGDVNPSGHLPETFPKRLEDNPSYLYYFGEGGVVNYNEGLFVGYRYYESKKQEVLFPFGHGLSYTTFRCSDLQLNKKKLTEGEDLTAAVTVTNIGKRAGKAVVQVYVAPEKVEMIRPVRELKDFVKVKLAPGESKTVTFTLQKRAFAHWNPTVHQWRTESGKYTIQIGENAHDICLEAEVQMEAEPVPPAGGYHIGIPMGEFAKSPKGRRFLVENIIYMIKGMAAAGFIPKEMAAMLEQLPGGVNLAAIDMLAQRAGNAAGGTGGVQVLLGQPLGMLDGFLPQEKQEELHKLLAELNQ
ncbi:glycoside hydrolase family 3 C-terminal domain-containing protein [Marvinbryantia formatexigens]|uniref:glycoside hydrolase family 3 C-terminal domain-containing protein n=1 Tax=Marvinbryantia formatexigens TaxID=168384 RepID=UPI0024170719|nr:glycoside hydrolase family 3 C-terminal domain-containing protein [Marvinbryantia formatexigens]